MKKLLFALILLAVGIPSLTAQGVFGLKAGLNGAFLSDRFEKSTTISDVNDLLVAFHAGAFYESAGIGLLGYRVELLFSRKGEAKEVYTTVTGDPENFAIDYLSLPIALLLSPVDRFSLEIGVEPSFAVANYPDDIELATSFDLGAFLGISAALSDHFVIGARYVTGFVDVVNSEVVDPNGVTIEDIIIRNQLVQLWLGYKF